MAIAKKGVPWVPKAKVRCSLDKESTELEPALSLVDTTPHLVLAVVSDGAPCGRYLGQWSSLLRPIWAGLFTTTGTPSATAQHTRTHDQTSLHSQRTEEGWDTARPLQIGTRTFLPPHNPNNGDTSSSTTTPSPYWHPLCRSQSHENCRRKSVCCPCLSASTDGPSCIPLCILGVFCCPSTQKGLVKIMPGPSSFPAHCDCVVRTTR